MEQLESDPEMYYRSCAWTRKTYKNLPST